MDDRPYILHDFDEAQGRCPDCGYNVRGVKGDLCPECGSPYYLQLANFQRQGQFNAAAAALKEEGFDVQCVVVPPRGNVTNQPWVSNVAMFGEGLIFVRRVEFVRARWLLDEVVQGFARPIVDRSEPVCPKCSGSLDPAGPEVCPHCHAPFQWVMIGAPDVDFTGTLCRHCGYELTGNVTDICPECGEKIDPTLDQIVEAASGRSRDESVSGQGQHPMRSLMLTFLLCLYGFAALLLIGLIIFQIVPPGSVGIVSAILVLLGVGLLCLLLIRFVLSKRKQ